MKNGKSQKCQMCQICLAYASAIFNWLRFALPDVVCQVLVKEKNYKETGLIKN